MDDVRRKVIFFKARCWQNAKEVAWNPRTTVATAKTAMVVDPKLSEADDTRLVGWVDGALELRVARSRLTALPPSEKNAVLSDLGLAADTGLAEVTHVVFFDNGVVGVEFNFYGPRASAIARYLSEKSGMLIRFDRLFRQDVMARLNSMKAIKRLTLRRPVHSNTDLGGMTDALAGLDKIASMGGAETVEVVVSAGRGRESFLNIGDGLRSLVGTVRSHDGVDVLKVSGIDADGERLTLNLLEDDIAVERTMRRAEGRRDIDQESAYSEIRAARDASLADLRTALTVSDRDEA